MRAEERVKQLWPEATIEGPGKPMYWSGYRVTIKPGRYAFGGTKTRAWTSAWDSITQDEELSKGAKK